MGQVIKFNNSINSTNGRIKGIFKSILTDFYIENRENITNFNENDIMLYMINGPQEKGDKIANRRF